MDNYDLVNYEGEGNLPASDPELDKPIPFDDSDPDPAVKSNGVSRQPLTLGGSAVAPGAKPASQPAPKSAAVSKPQPAAAKPASPKPAPTPVSAPSGPISEADDRIRGVKTFFTKLHPGAIVFLDEQVQNWLDEHPEVSIKRTNITVGEVQSKKTEPNLIVMVWY